jgi:hypothetical protein
MKVRDRDDALASTRDAVREPCETLFVDLYVLAQQRKM